jgi:hypothetical protein
MRAEGQLNTSLTGIQTTTKNAHASEAPNPGDFIS